MRQWSVWRLKCPNEWSDFRIDIVNQKLWHRFWEWTPYITKKKKAIIWDSDSDMFKFWLCKHNLKQAFVNHFSAMIFVMIQMSRETAKECSQKTKWSCMQVIILTASYHNLNHCHHHHHIMTHDSWLMMTPELMTYQIISFQKQNISYHIINKPINSALSLLDTVAAPKNAEVGWAVPPPVPICHRQ